MSNISTISNIAVRNLWRQKRRTLITVSALVIGLAVVTVLAGFRNAFIDLLLDTSINGQVGAFQVHVTGYMDDKQGAPLDMNMPTGAEVEAKLAAIPGVTATTPRIRFSGMVSSGATQTMFFGVGVDPVREYEVCPLFRGLAVDADGAPTTPIGPEHPDGILVGRALAEGLGVEIGGVVTLLVRTEAGGMNALDATIIGYTLPTNPFQEKRMVYAPLPFVQRLVRMEGKATELVVGVTDFDAIEGAAEAAASSLGPAYEVHTWEDVATFVRDAIARFSFVLGMVGTVLLLIVLTGIMNTVLMAVHERVREIGTMMAVGMRRRSILALFVAESVGICAVGAAGGLALGLAIVAWLNRTGVAVSPPGGGMTALIYPNVTATFLASTVLIAFVGGLLAAIYPAYRASRLRPVEALRAL